MKKYIEEETGRLKKAIPPGGLPPPPKKRGGALPPNPSLIYACSFVFSEVKGVVDFKAVRGLRPSAALYQFLTARGFEASEGIFLLPTWKSLWKILRTGVRLVCISAVPYDTEALALLFPQDVRYRLCFEDSFKSKYTDLDKETLQELRLEVGVTKKDPIWHHDTVWYWRESFIECRPCPCGSDSCLTKVLGFSKGLIEDIKEIWEAYHQVVLGPLDERTPSLMDLETFARGLYTRIQDLGYSLNRLSSYPDIARQVQTHRGGPGSRLSWDEEDPDLDTDYLNLLRNVQGLGEGTLIQSSQIGSFPEGYYSDRIGSYAGSLQTVGDFRPGTIRILVQDEDSRNITKGNLLDLRAKCLEVFVIEGKIDWEPTTRAQSPTIRKGYKGIYRTFTPPRSRIQAFNKDIWEYVEGMGGECTPIKAYWIFPSNGNIHHPFNSILRYLYELRGREPYFGLVLKALYGILVSSYERCEAEPSVLSALGETPQFTKNPGELGLHLSTFFNPMARASMLFKSQVHLLEKITLEGPNHTRANNDSTATTAPIPNYPYGTKLGEARFPLRGLLRNLNDSRAIYPNKISPTDLGAGLLNADPSRREFPIPGPRLRRVSHKQVGSWIRRLWGETPGREMLQRIKEDLDNIGQVVEDEEIIYLGSNKLLGHEEVTVGDILDGKICKGKFPISEAEIQELLERPEGRENL